MLGEEESCVRSFRAGWATGETEGTAQHCNDPSDKSHHEHANSRLAGLSILDITILHDICQSSWSSFFICAG